MSVELGTSEWVAAFRDSLNASDAYHRAAAGWHWPVALRFAAEGDWTDGDRYVWLDLHEGTCRAAEVVDADRYGDAPFRFAAPYSRWMQIIHGTLEPIKGIVLHRLKLEGDLLTVFRFMPAAKAMLECACRIDTVPPAG